MTLGLVIFVLPLPSSSERKRIWTRYTVWLACWLYVRIMRSFGILTFELVNTDQLRDKGQLIVANHPTLIDVIFLISVVPDANCIVKENMFTNPFTFALVTLADYLSNNSDSETLIDKASETLKAGQTLIIFPEGTRSRHATPLKFKRGAANIALAASCSVRPVVINVEPPTLRKNEPWYQIPERASHFRIEAMPMMLPSNIIDMERTSGVQARQLTKHLQHYFETALRRV